MLTVALWVSLACVIISADAQDITCDESKNETYRLRTCDVTCDDLALQCNYPGLDRMDCFCKEGYVRSRLKQCILIADCETNRCGLNEVYRYNDCDNRCDPRYKCDSGPYRMDCWCIEEYVRDSENKCIPKEECPQCNPDEEYRMDHCDRRCGPFPSPCPNIPDFMSCWCKSGYSRDGTNRCVPEDQCKLCEGENEEFRDGTCDATCGKPNYTCYVEKHPGCFCKEGRVRNEDGNCIPVDTCGKCKGRNEEYKMGDCDEKCDRRNYICPRAPTRMGCWCRQGYARYENDCVPIHECPRCGADEQNRPGRCDNWCDGQTHCTPGPDYEDCWCPVGDVRNGDGYCVKPSACPGQCQTNEEHRSGVCDPTCEFPNDRCTGGDVATMKCWCKEGTVRNAQGQCVDPKECPNLKCEGDNEEYRRDKCDGVCEYPERKNCSVSPNFACFCLEDHLRDKDWKCVPADECVMRDCGPNAVLNKCPGYCSFDRNCLGELNGILPMCAFPIGGWACRPRCECKDGYVRIDGECLSVDKCCKGTNEVAVKCPAKCDLTCDGKIWDKCEQQPCGRAKLRCRCREDHVRNPNGECVPRDQCEPLPKCKRNEVLNICPRYCTFDPDCQSEFEGIIRDCAAPPPDYQCKPRCDCKPGFLRFSDGCLSPDRCCTGKNEISTDCPAKCDDTCDGKAAKDCQLEKCFSKGCVCKKNFVRNDKGVCVRRNQCRHDSDRCSGNSSSSSSEESNSSGVGDRVRLMRAVKTLKQYVRLNTKVRRAH